MTARPSKTIIGAAHQQITLAWWETRNQYELLVSESVLRECEAGDPGAAQKRLAALRDVPLLLVNEQALNIAEGLVEKGIVPSKAAEDALHIAVATVHGVDYLLTWNCRHIANPAIQRGIAGYLERVGYFLPFICTPEELLGDDNPSPFRHSSELASPANKKVLIHRIGRLGGVCCPRRQAILSRLPA